MEFSKKWLICSALVSIALIIACAAGADLTEITLAVLAETFLLTPLREGRPL